MENNQTGGLMREPKVYLKIVINFIIAILAVLFTFLLLPKILGFFMPFVIGWIVAMIANPLVKFLEKRVRLLRKHSSAIIIVVVVAAIVGAIYLIIAVLVREVKSLSSDLPNIFTQVEQQLENLSERVKDISGSLPASLQRMIDNLINGISSNITNFNTDENMLTLSTAGNFAKDIAEVFLMVIVTILSAYFFIARRDELVAGLKKNMPNSLNSGWLIIYENFKTAVGGYFKAQFKIMFIIIAIMFIGFEILGVGYSFLLAFGIALLDLLPVFGTGAILWPWALIDMLMGNYVRAIGLVVIYLICQIVKQILQPKMVGDSIGISPLATLVFMYIGYRFYGVLGMILGIPIGMVLVNLYRIGTFDRLIEGLRIIIHDINEFRKF
jgi:sporulation integral membrane protein YtvI